MGAARLVVGRWGAKGFAVACALVPVMVAATAAQATTLSGRTTQRAAIRVSLRRGRVASVRVTVSAGCNDGERIRRTVTLTGVALRHGRFSDAVGSGAERAVVIGTVRGRSARGELRVFFMYTLAARLSRDGVVFCDTGTGSQLVRWSAGRGARARAANVERAFNPGANCINYDPGGYRNSEIFHDALNNFAIRAPSDGSADETAAALPVPARTRILPSYRAWFGDGRNDGVILPPRSIIGVPLNFRIFLAPDLARSYGGVTASTCDRTNQDEIVLASDYLLRGFSSLPAILAHELAHAFQSGVAGMTVIDNWFMEASAEYFASLVAPDPVVLAERDAAFFGDPSISLDSYGPGTSENAHEYGAFRFVQYLAAQLGSRADVYAFVREMIERTGRTNTPSETVTDTLASILAARGESFADDLGHFWAEHMLDPSQQPSGPTGRRVDPPVSVLSVSGDTAFSAQRVAAQFATFQLASGIRKVTFSTTGAGTNGRFWVSFDGTLQNWSTGGSATFCVGQPSPGTFRWPGEVRMVYVNTAIHGPTSSMPIHVDTSNDSCVPDDPAPSTPYESLGRTCPPTPLAPPGRGQNASWVFLYLFNKVFADMTDWSVGAFFVSPTHRRSLSVGERNFARVLDCTADRASVIPAGAPTAASHRQAFVHDLRQEARYTRLALTSHGRRQVTVETLAAQAGMNAISEWEAVGSTFALPACNEWRRVNDRIGCGAITDG